MADDSKGALVLLRHGCSAWNLQDRFTGWVNIPLDMQGVEEAFAVGEKVSNINFDAVFTSTLIRAQMTAYLVMMKQTSGRIPLLKIADCGQAEHKGWDAIYSHEGGADCVPLVCAWELNERYYGQLQGLSKEATRQRFGKDQVKKWRRSFEEVPPKGESLEMTAQRTIPYFNREIRPLIQQGRSILVVAHGNSLRAIVMELDRLKEKELIQLEIPTGGVLRYQWDEKSQSFYKP